MNWVPVEGTGHFHTTLCFLHAVFKEIGGICQFLTRFFGGTRQ